LLIYFLDCNNGTFGDGCVLRCHCQSGLCDKMSGLCPDKLCQPGWIGDSCSEGIWLRQFATAPNEQQLSRDVVRWQGTININLSVILSFNCGNTWAQSLHFYLRNQRRPWASEQLLPFIRQEAIYFVWYVTATLLESINTDGQQFHQFTKTDNHLFCQQYENFASLLCHHNIYPY